MKAKLKPHDQVQLNVPTSTRPRMVEAISYPYDGKIMVRMVPGDPTSLREVSTKDISAILPKPRRWIHIAEVQGSFSFPEDMLRYDDAALINPDQEEYPEMGWRPEGPVLIYCVSEHRTPRWTSARWASFSWTIKPIKTFDLKKQPFTEQQDIGGES